MCNQYLTAFPLSPFTLTLPRIISYPPQKLNRHNRYCFHLSFFFVPFTPLLTHLYVRLVQFCVSS